MTVIYMCTNISFILNIWPAILQKIKQGKIQKFTWNKFSEVFIQIPGTYKKTSRSYRYTNKCSK